MKRRTPRGGPEQNITCTVACTPCGMEERRFLPVRTILKTIAGEIVCPLCRRTLSVKKVDE